MPTIDSTEEITEGAFVYTEEDGVCKIIENTMRFDTREEEWKGGIQMSPKWSGQTKEYYAGLVKDLITANEIFLVPEEIVDNPREIIIRFAMEEFTTELTHLEPTLEYCGVEHVEQLGDIKAAAGLIEGEL
jgi:hypothetical protein